MIDKILVSRHSIENRSYYNNYDQLLFTCVSMSAIVKVVFIASLSVFVLFSFLPFFRPSFGSQASWRCKALGYDLALEEFVP